MPYKHDVCLTSLKMKTVLGKKGHVYIYLYLHRKVSPLVPSYLHVYGTERSCEHRLLWISGPLWVPPESWQHGSSLVCRQRPGSDHWDLRRWPACQRHEGHCLAPGGPCAHTVSEQASRTKPSVPQAGVLSPSTRVCSQSWESFIFFVWSPGVTVTW